MSAFHYLVVLVLACLLAALIFFGVLEHYKMKHGEKMPAQSRFLWGATLVFAICFIITLVQVVD